LDDELAQGAARAPDLARDSDGGVDHDGAQRLLFVFMVVRVHPAISFDDV
jgi:hypothetical protein